MSTTATHTVRRTSDHFEPEPNLDPHEQRKLRGHLEQIDYAAYAANREIAAQLIGRTDMAAFERLAVIAAQSRSQWVAAALALAKAAHAPTAQQIEELTALRHAYEELTDVYEGMRRMVERGYLPLQAPPKS